MFASYKYVCIRITTRQPHQQTIYAAAGNTTWLLAEHKKIRLKILTGMVDGRAVGAL